MIEFIYAVRDHLPTFLLIFFRLSALLMTMPLFGYVAIYSRLRVMLAFVISILVFPALGGSSVSATVSGSFILMVINEIFIGLVLGYGARIIFEGFNMAGSFVARQMGLAMANVLDPTSGEQQPILSQFWFLLMLVYLLALNGHFFLLEVIVNNFRILPLAGAVVQNGMGDHLAHGGSLAFEIGIKIAAPVLTLLLVLDSALALVARVMPQMNVFFVTLPLKLGVGLVAVISSLNIFQLLFAFFLDDLTRFVEGVFLNIS